MKDFTDITILLDRSGSMVTILESTITGFNTFLAEQKKEKDKARLSLIQFDNEYEINYLDIDLDYVEDLNTNTFKPRGGTALLDAIGRTITDKASYFKTLKKKNRPNKVLIVIITDGYENCSVKFDYTKLSKLITKYRHKDWEFAFIGANQDSIAEASKLGFNIANATNFTADAEGTKNVFTKMSANVASYRSNGEYTNGSK